MVCPYVRKSETHIQHWGQTPDENTGHLARGTTIDKWTYTLMECEKENCGVWQNGKCCYSSVKLKDS
jgi:hypothetical protein